MRSCQLGNNYSAGLRWLRTGLLWLGNILMATAAYLGLVLYTNTFVYGFVVGVLGATAYTDFFVVREIEPMVGSQLRWKQHFLPSVVIMHFGTAIIAVWNYFQSSVLFLGGCIIIIGGFLAVLNQLSSGPLDEEG